MLDSGGLHVICERDVGLFSLVQQVLANLPWALGDGRVPIVNFGRRTAYWTPQGHHGADSVWEYYFEPVVEGFPASSIPSDVQERIEHSFPNQDDVGYFLSPQVFVTNTYGEHEDIVERALQIPYATGDPSYELRSQAAELIEKHLRPREFLRRKANGFYRTHLAGRHVIGVHVRGTDAVSSAEQREYRQGSLSYERFINAIETQLSAFPDASIFVATDAETSLDRMREAFGDRVVAYDSIRDQGGEPAGVGPTGRIMPAYITQDPSVAAQNGEDAVVEYLLLGRCSHLVHNGASLATTVLLSRPELPHTNTRRPR